MTIPVSLRLEPELKNELEELARNEERSVSQVAVRAIRAYVEMRKEKEKAIDKALEMADEGKFVSSEAVHEWMQTWGTDEELPPPEPDVFLRRG
jgi:predicted transcriptional regulator